MEQQPGQTNPELALGDEVKLITNQLIVDVTGLSHQTYRELRDSSNGASAETDQPFIVAGEYVEVVTVPTNSIDLGRQHIKPTDSGILCHRILGSLAGLTDGHSDIYDIPFEAVRQLSV